MLTNKKIVSKIQCILDDYAAIAYEQVGSVRVKWLQTREHLRKPPAKNAGWKAAKPGTKWGGDWMTGWFSGVFKVGPGTRGITLYLRADVGGRESLAWINKEPRGILTPGFKAMGNQHGEILLTESARTGQRFEIDIESYAWHPQVNVGPRGGQAASRRHVFNNIHIVIRREDVWALVMDIRTLMSLAEALDDNSLRKNRINRTFLKVYKILPQLPAECTDDDVEAAVAKARKLLKPLLACRNSETTPFVALSGHSHMDTAWLWPIAETERKCARTYANALSLMEEYPGYRFFQSSSYHGDMMKRLYPQVFRRMQKMVKTGRWEPNGGSWVEPDCNVIGSESLVRQFLVGQNATEEMYGYRSDTFWMPDTFGYSAALPQILKGCGIDYFCTTKLTWNDTNRFPFDTFHWLGLDGTSVLSHFNAMHGWPDPKTIKGTWDWVQHKDVQDRRMYSYGFGDGGGGPIRMMLELVSREKDLEGMPRTREMSVSDFMKGVESELNELPEYRGELYPEFHRGTLTSIHGVKRGNRKSETALRSAELLCARAALAGAKYPAKELNALWKNLLINQFHDILPGTSIPEVNDQAIGELGEICADAEALAKRSATRLVTARGNDAIELHNTLNWDRAGELSISWTEDTVPVDGVSQVVKDIEGNRHLVMSGVTLPALGSAVVPLKAKGRAGASPFKVNGNRITTPHAYVRFDATGGIASFCDRASGRELVRDRRSPLNSLWIGQDVPANWDNWDIDEDQALKMERETRLVSQKVVAKGPLQLRIRQTYKLGRASKLVQDIVFHATTPQVDFETKVEWNEKHMLLKAGFDVDVFCDKARHEIQFGHVERNTHSNLTTDRAQFESCNHRWTDVSEPDFGVALLNDCKYGISVHGSDMRLSLLKSGTHPDPRGDNGVHVMTYSLLSHSGTFSVESVVRPGYELNTPVVVAPVSSKASGSDSLFTTSSDSVIVEAVKRAEDGKGFIVRMYEAAGGATRCRVKFGVPVNKVTNTNMLEEPEKSMSVSNNACRLSFRPFEIKTLRVE